MITNFFLKKEVNFSKKASPFFGKEAVKSFFLLENTNKNYLTTLVVKDLNKVFWSKKNVKNVESVSNANYIYKPDFMGNIKTNFECFFLRKSKSFNKGRYSRNRQVYRTGVYMCFYINVIALYLLWFYFYKFKFKFTYLWWLFIMLPFSFVNARALKYNLYFPKEFMFHFNSYVNWFLFFFRK